MQFNNADSGSSSQCELDMQDVEIHEFFCSVFTENPQNVLTCRAFENRITILKEKINNQHFYTASTRQLSVKLMHVIVVLSLKEVPATGSPKPYLVANFCMTKFIHPSLDFLDLSKLASSKIQAGFA